MILQWRLSKRCDPCEKLLLLMEALLIPTLAVAVCWGVMGLVALGCGYVTRRCVFSLLPGEAHLRLNRADLWIGFAALIGFLQLWTFAFRISWVTALLPVAVGLVGVVWGRKAFRRPELSRRLVLVAVAAGGAIVWFANKALGTPVDYDFGLYHLSIVYYASHYPVIPGLGNLHDRLGAGDAHLLFVALLGRGPWSTGGYQFANGLLVSMFVADVASRFSRPSLRPTPFTRRMAALLVVGTIWTAGIGGDYRLSSPNLDLATFVLVAVGALYLAECVESGYTATAALAGTGSLAAAAATRPLYWIPTLVATAVIVVGGGRPRRAARATDRVILAGALPVVLGIGWMARQAILTGYPLFPITVGGLPVEWRMPASNVHQMADTVAAWARWPARPPDEVLASWQWLGHWLRARAKDLDIAAVLVLLAVSLPAFADRSPGAVLRRKERRSPMLAVLALAIPTLVLWFLLAPEPRFALAPLWLVPVALVAWALPDRDADPELPSPDAEAHRSRCSLHRRRDRHVFPPRHYRRSCLRRALVSRARRLETTVGSALATDETPQRKPARTRIARGSDHRNGRLPRIQARPRPGVRNRHRPTPDDCTDHPSSPAAHHNLGSSDRAASKRRRPLLSGAAVHTPARPASEAPGRLGERRLHQARVDRPPESPETGKPKQAGSRATPARISARFRRRV